MTQKDKERQIEAGDKVKWIDPVSGRTRTGIVGEVTQIIGESEEIKNFDDPYEPVRWKKDVDKVGYSIKCDQGGTFTFAEDEIEKVSLEVIKPN